MPTRLNTHFLPQLVAPAELRGSVVVVIDVLRASTTICHALAAGARWIVPCREVDEARQIAVEAASAGEQVVLGGEREGVRIEGFQLGNSPGEYMRESVGGRIVIFTTTNGTRAMKHAATAEGVLIGGFVNAAAVVEKLAAYSGKAHLLCAGTRGQVTREDILLAGLLAQRLQARQPQLQRNDQTRLAQAAWGEAAPVGVLTSEELADCAGGRNMTRLGQQQDIQAAAELDCFNFAPVLDLEAWKITRDSTIDEQPVEKP